MSRSASQIVRDSVSDAVGSHRFSPHQIETFQTLQHTIACCGYLFGILATIDGLQSAFVAFYDTDRITRVGVPYGQLASVLHDGSSAFFLLQVAGCLHTLVQETGNHMPHLMKVRYAVHLCIHTSQEYTQAIVQLTNLFLQLAVFCASISIIQFIEAALLFPNIKYVIYTILGAAALLRSICLGYVYSKYHADVLLGAADVWDRRQQQQRDSSAPTEHSEAPQSTRQAARSWWDRVALRVNGSFLVPAALPSEFKAAAPPQNEFEFTAFDEQLCLALVGAMRMAGVFYFLEGCATFLFVIAAVLSRQLSRGLPLGMEVVSCMAYASMIFGAADAFQRIVTTQGNDVGNLLHACTFLNTLFDKLSVVALSLSGAQALAIARAGWAAGTLVKWPAVSAGGAGLVAGLSVKITQLQRTGQLQAMLRSASRMLRRPKQA